MEFSGISVVVLGTARAVSIRAQVELAAVLKEQPDALVSFATGGTFRVFFEELERDAEAGRLDLSQFRVTHLDEFLGYSPSDAPGFAHELLQCAPIRRAYDEGRFVPVPSGGEPADLHAHEAKLAALGGVKLQFLGIGGNGHVAFSEPGTPLELGFHRARLAATTRSSLESRFGPAVPTEAVTAGPATVLASGRAVLVAVGSGKAKAVRDMLEGDIGPACPASVLRRHPDALVLLDPAAAAGLDWPELASSAIR